MGICSTKFRVRKDVEGQGQEVWDTAERLGMTKSDVHAIFKKFKFFDVQRDDHVTIQEFVVLCECEAETFICLVFRLFDHSGKGQVSFHEFLTAYFHFLTLDKDDLALFTYQVFDLDGEGSLSKEEVKVMCITLWGAKKAEKHYKEMQKLDLDGDGELSANEWLNICKHNPNMLFQAFSTQEHLRAGSLGAKRWAALTAQRNKKFKEGKHYKSVLEINETGVKCDPQRALIALKDVHGLPPSLKVKVNNAEKSVKKAAEMKRRNEQSLKDRANHYHTPGSDHSALSKSKSHSHVESEGRHDDHQLSKSKSHSHVESEGRHDDHHSSQKGGHRDNHPPDGHAGHGRKTSSKHSGDHGHGDEDEDGHHHKAKHGNKVHASH